MASDLQQARDQDESVTTLITGIIDDAQKLFTQQLSHFRTEIQSDFEKTKDAAAYLALGAALAIPGCLLFCMMLVHLIHWATSPAGTDPASMPLWACYALVGALLAIPGSIFICVGMKKFRSFNPLPDQSADALMESLKWTTSNNK